MSEFEFFENWMKNNSGKWRMRKGLDLTVPKNLKYTLGRGIIPVYSRFLEKFGAIELFKWKQGNRPDGFALALLTPEEIAAEFVDGLLRWNNPERNLDFGCFFPYCRNCAQGSCYCFDMGFPGEDDFPVVEVLPSVMKDVDEARKDSASFKDWLEKIVKFGEP